MSTNSPASAKQLTTKLNFNILVENQDQDLFRAIVLGLPDCQVEGANKEEAIANIRQLLTERLAKADIISLEVESPNNEHPWMEFAGMYANNPLFDEVLTDIAAYRDEIDAEMEEYYRQVDAKEIVK
ncbi:HicB family protein [Moorena producens PAL-8-15-08-1]|uniref:HicB family protein n=1 Tax=Moorena producens PAL-8-15-08-1 TaxID=1458985 RepID=A0A1D8TRQ1_9CYAN|nr:HicB family protein [Moorena producens]AOX00320.1 HicB family protein [Moorena producens PAL-8-15-08-1]